MYFLHVLLQILIQLFTYCLDKSFAVQNGRIFNAGDQCQVFCHLSAFNRGKGCFFQFVCKYAKLRNLIQLTAFAECPRSMQRSLPRSSWMFLRLSGIYNSDAEPFRELLRTRNCRPVIPVRKSSSPVNQRQKKPCRS